MEAQMIEDVETGIEYDEVEAIAEALDASAQEAQRVEAVKLAAKKAKLKVTRTRHKREQRASAAAQGHKLGNRNRKCKRCGVRRTAFTGQRCIEAK